MNVILSIIVTATTTFNLPTNLLMAVCYTESKLDPQAVHHDDGGSDSLGLCQIKLSTAQWLGFTGTREQLMNPETNAYYSAKYLKHQLLRYNNNITKAIIAYNRGSAGDLKSTEYSAKVLTNLKNIQLYF